MINVRVDEARSIDESLFVAKSNCSGSSCQNSMSSSPNNESSVPFALSYARSSSSSRHSNDSDDSQELRALELREDPITVYHASGAFNRPRSESITVFRFQNDLLPLSESLSVETLHSEGSEKSISLLSGAFKGSVFLLSWCRAVNTRYCPCCWTSGELHPMFILLSDSQAQIGSGIL